MRILHIVHKTISTITSSIFDFICKRRIENDNFTLLCPNCIGGIIYHRVGKKFRSPTLNTSICASDFLKFVADYKAYLSYDLQFINKTDRDYPCALLGDILINFVHYTTEEDAKACWYRRLSRINWDNIYIILYEREDTTREDLLSLRNIPCKKIAVLTQFKNNLDIDYVHYIKPIQGTALTPYFLNYDFFGIRAFEKQWDFVKWLNS